jgi:hypothetical protein
LSVPAIKVAVVADLGGRLGNQHLLVATARIELRRIFTPHVLGLPLLEWIESVDELLEAHVPSTNPYNKSFLLIFHEYLSLAISVDSLLVPDKNHFGLFRSVNNF